MVQFKLQSIVCLIFLLSVIIFGQTEKQNKTIPSRNIHVIIIKSSGNCTVRTNSQNDINLDADLTKTGTVIGYKNITTPPLNIMTEGHNDTIIVTTTPINKVVAIGYSTYTENLELNITLPLTINKIKVECKNILRADLTQQNVGSILFDARSEIFFNGVEKNQGFEFGGTGPQNFNLKADKINVIVKK